MTKALSISLCSLFLSSIIGGTALATSNSTTVVTPDHSETENAESENVEMKNFRDVPTNHPYGKAILELRKTSLLKGYPDESYRPEQPLNRVEALKLIFEAAAIQLDNEVAPAEFSDTEKKAWYSGYLNKAVFLEVVNGYSDGSFRASNPVNLVEFLKMLLIAQKADFSGLNLAEMSYADIQPGQWYMRYVNFAKKHGLLDTDKNNRINPSAPLSRGRAAEIIHRFRQMKSRPASAVKPSDELALYVSKGHKFAIRYPKLWFYAYLENSATPDSARTYGFGPKDLNLNPPAVTLKLLPASPNFSANKSYQGFDYARDVAEDGQILLSAKINGSPWLFQLSGSLVLEESMVQMISSLTADIDGLESYNPAAKTTTP